MFFRARNKLPVPETFKWNEHEQFFFTLRITWKCFVKSWICWFWLPKMKIALYIYYFIRWDMELVKKSTGFSPPARMSCVLSDTVPLKWSGSFFLNHNKSLRWHLGDYEKQFFPIWRPVRGGTLVFLCSYGCVVGPCSYTSTTILSTCSYTDPLHIRKNTQKSKFLLS